MTQEGSEDWLRCVDSSKPWRQWHSLDSAQWEQVCNDMYDAKQSAKAKAQIAAAKAHIDDALVNASTAAADGTRSRSGTGSGMFVAPSGQHLPGSWFRGGTDKPVKSPKHSQHGASENHGLEWPEEAAKSFTSEPKQTKDASASGGAIHPGWFRGAVQGQRRHHPLVTPESLFTASVKTKTHSKILTPEAMHSMSTADLQIYLLDVFSAADTDHNGHLDPSEVSTALC